MAQNRIRPTMGPSEKHLRRTPLGSCQHRIPILHILLPDNGLQSLRARLVHRIRHTRRSHDLFLGQRPMVNGKPVQLGQASRTLRNLHHLPRTNISHTSWHVPWRDPRDGALGSYGRTPWLGHLLSPNQRLLARCYPSLLSDTCVAVRYGYGSVFVSLRSTSRGIVDSPDNRNGRVEANCVLLPRIHPGPL